MKKIKGGTVAEVVTKLACQANTIFPEPITRLIDQAIEQESSPVSKQALSAILTNIRLAKKLSLPLCQDTGMVEVFLEVGNGVQIDLAGFNSLEEVVNKGVASAYKENYFRCSVVDPFCRKNTGDNTPAIVHTRLVKGDRLSIKLLVKGFGSENMGKVGNLSPGSETLEIVNFIVKAVKEAGTNPCPPVLIGCGIGGTMEKALLLAKEALLCPERIGKANPDKGLRFLEREVLRRVNKLGIGPCGLGGKTTALAIRALSFPTHIAGLPVAVNISCWALRVASTSI